MQLSEIKTYLHIVNDVDDDLLQSLQQAAITYIENTTNKAYDDNNELHKLLCKLLVVHWYEHRDSIDTTQGATVVPHSVDALLYHIANCQLYSEAAQP